MRVVCILMAGVLGASCSHLSEKKVDSSREIASQKGTEQESSDSDCLMGIRRIDSTIKTTTHRTWRPTKGYGKYEPLETKLSEYTITVTAELASGETRAQTLQQASSGEANEKDYQQVASHGLKPLIQAMSCKVVLDNGLDEKSAQLLSQTEQHGFKDAQKIQSPHVVNSIDYHNGVLVPWNPALYIKSMFSGEGVRIPWNPKLFFKRAE